MPDQLQRLLDELPSFAQLDSAGRADLLRRAEQTRPQDWDEGAAMLAALARLLDDSGETDALQHDHGLWLHLFAGLARLAVDEPRSQAIPPAALENAIALYRRLGAASEARHALLALLAGSGQPETLAAFAELVVADPPSRPQDAALAFVPL